MTSEKIFMFDGIPEPSTAVINMANEFASDFEVLELQILGKLLLNYDKKSKSYYVVCHIPSSLIASKTDLEAVLDPEESEEYKLNRNLYTDNYAYSEMEKDAIAGRSFEDLVVEFDKSYRPEKPLKVFGGQHRTKAIQVAVKEKVHAFHGVRIYFDLSLDQRLDIATTNNTSIAVSKDLLDRMQEDFLGSQLRQWCQRVGILSDKQNFADKRSSLGIPTVRIARTLIVNFYLGKKAEPDGLNIPVVCSSGPNLDKSYMKIRGEINWRDESLEIMGKEFCRLHKLQLSRVSMWAENKFSEFSIKAIHPTVAAAWAYAAGMFQKYPDALKNHYALPETVNEPQDPLNAKALLGARLKGVDNDTYRGLGARINSDELGRMVEVFTLQAIKATKKGINLTLANTAIQSYEAKKAKNNVEKAIAKI